MDARGQECRGRDKKRAKNILKMLFLHAKNKFCFNLVCLLQSTRYWFLWACILFFYDCHIEKLCVRFNSEVPVCFNDRIIGSLMSEIVWCGVVWVSSKLLTIPVHCRAMHERLWWPGSGVGLAAALAETRTAEGWYVHVGLQNTRKVSNDKKSC